MITPQVVEVLTAYVREHASWRSDDPQMTIARPGGPETPDSTSTAPPTPPPTPHADTAELATDVQAAMTVLGRRDALQDQGGQLDLASTDLNGANLQGAKLQGADLIGANLHGKPKFGISGAPFQGWANFTGTHYDTHTKWPQGFDYRAAGATAVDEDMDPGSVLPPD